MVKLVEYTYAEYILIKHSLFYLITIKKQAYKIVKIGMISQVNHP